MLPATPMNIFLDHHARRRHAQQSNSNNHNTSSTMTDTKLPRSILSTSVVRNGATNDDGNRNRNSNNDTYANANANNNRRHHNSHNNNHHQPEKPQSQSQDSVMHCDTTDPAGDSDDYEIDDCQEDDNDDDDDDDEFRLTIPSLLLTHTHESLAQMDQTVLAKCLNPVMESLRMLDAESLLNLQRVDNGARLCDGVNVRPIHEEVYPRYEQPEGMSFVRYIHITEVPEQYSVGIFVFPPFARIPLHDHPEMCVLSRLLYGDLQCLSLDLLKEDTTTAAAAAATTSTSTATKSRQHDRHSAVPNTVYNEQQGQQEHQNAMLPPGLPPGSRRVLKNPIKHLHAPDVSMLFPFQGNLHEFYAGPNGAAVLDILLPPYDANHDRDCTFYDIREGGSVATAAAALSSHPSSSIMDHDTGNDMVSSMMDMDDAALVNPNDGDDGDGTASCWIVPTGQPHDFHCLSGKYKKLGTHVISTQD